MGMLLKAARFTGLDPGTRRDRGSLSHRKPATRDISKRKGVWVGKHDRGHATGEVSVEQGVSERPHVEAQLCPSDEVSNLPERRTANHEAIIVVCSLGFLRQALLMELS